MYHPEYSLTPLTAQLNKMIMQQLHPHAFAIANFGEGPLLNYRGRSCRIQNLCVRFNKSGQLYVLSHLSPPPYLLLMAQKKESRFLSAVFYGDNNAPLFESSGEDPLMGHLLVCGIGKGGSLVVIHAVSCPEESSIFFPVNQNSSVLMEGNPEVCRHLLLCGKLMDSLLMSPVDQGCSPQQTPVSHTPSYVDWDQKEAG